MGLQPGKQRIYLAQAEGQTAYDEGKRAQNDQSKLMVQPKHEIHAAKHQHGGTDHAPHKQRHEVLDLRDVVGDPRHQGSGAETIDLRKRKGHNVAEGILAHFVSDILRRHVDECVVQRTAQAAHKHQADHPQPQ